MSGSFYRSTLGRAALPLMLAAASILMAVKAGANGGHFLVDDAATTPPQTCALETWVTRMDPTTRATVAPMCNITGASEWKLPLEYNLSNDELTTIGLDYKRVLWASRSGPALAGSAGFRYNRVTSEMDTYYLNIPLSFQPMDSLTLHLNGGVEHDRPLDDTYATWGVAATFKPVTGPIWILEMYDNDRRQDPIIAGGARMNVGSTRWTLDLGLARDTQLDETAYTLGINIPRLF